MPCSARSLFVRPGQCNPDRHKPTRHVLPRNLLHLLGQFAHLSAILFVGRSHMQGQQMPQRIDRRMNLRALAPSLAPS